MQHVYMIQHASGAMSGPFRTYDKAEQALIASLAAGGTGEIVDQWRGTCARCQQTLHLSAGYVQHGCGEIYDLDPLEIPQED